MDGNRTYERLLSFSASLMITTGVLATAPAGIISAASGPTPAVVAGALDALKAEGWRGIQGVTVPSAVPAPSPAVAASKVAAKEAKPLSDEQLKKLLEDTAANGKKGQLVPYVTEALGLSAPGEVLTLQQDPFKNNGVHRAFVPLDKGRGYLLVVKNNEAPARAYLVDMNLKLKDAVVNTDDTLAGIVHIASAQAEKELSEEWAFWRQEIDGGFQ